MKTTLQHYFLAFGFWLLAFGLQAQDYQWNWAKSGGGNLGIASESSGAMANDFDFEHISDIVTDEDNNYYFLGKISHSSSSLNSHVDGNEVTTFGSGTTGSHNILITSFTCNGTYRWSRVIGGGGVTSGRHANKLVLDNNGGVYVNVFLTGNTTGSNNQPPICFGENNCLPYLTGDNYEEQEGIKPLFLLKYDTDNGDLLWRKDYQQNVSYYNGNGFITDLQIDSSNVLHTIIGLQDGVHLDGALTVELDEDEELKCYLVKFNSTTGALIGTPLLLPLKLPPLTAIMNKTSFRYDENLNRYYLISHRDSSSNPAPSFNGVTFQSSSTGSYGFLMSFNPNDFDDWWYKEINWSGANQMTLRWITSIEIDDNSDIYIGGNIAVNPNSSTFFGDHLIGEHPVTTSYSGQRPFILKMNSTGEVQWSKIPSGYIDPVASTGTYYAYDVAINGNEVALATHGRSTVWDNNFSIDRPAGHQNDPYLIRFNKQTGEVIGLHDIYGSSGHHQLTAVTADNDGNYVVGGAMRYSLFTDNPNGISTLYNTSSGGAYTDFFMARLAATECGTNVFSNEAFYKPQIRLYPNPTNGLVYIETSQSVQSYEVYNLLGQRLLQGGFNSSNSINLQELNSGTYIVKVRTQNGEVMTSKIIKQ